VVALTRRRPERDRHAAEGLLDRIEERGYRAGPLPPENPATAREGDYRFGRQDGKTPCAG
jgi:hypothetical protein